MRRSMGWMVVASVIAILATPATTAFGASQMFPSKREAKGLSAYLVKPTEGQAARPEGWDYVTGSHFGNCAIADESFNAAAAGAVCKTTSYELPKADYTVSVLVRGKGKARLAGSESWTDFETPRGNYYQWVEVGTVKDATTVSVEVEATGGTRSLNYGGLLAEGTVLPVVPVSKVCDRIKAGGPATVVLLGDSVTENARGTGGGSSSFEKGNPGLTLAFLKQFSGKDVDYLAHREPASWPAGRDPAALPTATIDGKTYYDSRIELDASKPIHLANLGKGGAAADWGWSRMGDVIIDNDYLDAKVPKDQHKDSVRFGMAHYKPDLVIINFGTNDVNGVHQDWLVEDYLFHMKVLATNIQRQFGAAVILSTPHKWTGGVHLASHRQPQMVEALRDYCRATGIALADVYNEYAAGEYDGIHPRDVGHKHIADAYAKAIQGLPSEPAIKAQTTAAELKDNGDGTVTDTETGLVWTRSASVAETEKTADETAVFVAAFNAESKLGHNDWRLPTRDELLKLVDPLRRSPALPEGHPFTDVAGWYRASDKGWGVDMDTGVPWSTGKSAGRPARVWLVRGGK